jgi:hypothetical protein
MFATSAKIYPYFNQIVSVRIIIAKFYRLPEEDIGKEDILFYKEEFSKSGKELEEEKDDDDEVEGEGGEKKDEPTTKEGTKKGETGGRENVYKEKETELKA